MIYYFDVKETFVKTVGVEANTLGSAYARVEGLYNSNAIDLGKYPYEIEIECVQNEVENCITQGDITTEEIEIFE